MTSVHPTDTWADSPFPVKGAFSPFAELVHAPFERVQEGCPSYGDEQSGHVQKIDFEQAINEIGERLTLDIPGFLALYVCSPQVKSPAPSLSLGLVTHHPLTPQTKRTLQVAIGRFLGIPRISLGCWTPANLRSELLKEKTGIEVLLGGTKITGIQDPLASIGVQFAKSPAPQAALTELQKAFEALLRFPPNGDSSDFDLTPSPQDFHPNIGPVLAIEHLTNAMLLKLGAYTSSLEERKEVLKKTYPVSPSRLKLLIWGLEGGYEDPPLDTTELSAGTSEAEALWHKLRHLCLGLYVSIRFPDAEMEIDSPKHPIFKEVTLPKSRLGRWWRKLREPRSVDLGLDPYGRLLLALVLAKTAPDKENKQLCNKIADILPNLGGGILANPTWENLRKEAMVIHAVTQPNAPLGFRDFLSAI